MAIFALAGLALLVFCFAQCKERVVMDAKESENVKVSDLWMEFLRNRPLRVLAFFFITAFAMMSIGNAADAYFMTYNVGAPPVMTTAFMWLGTSLLSSSCLWFQQSSARSERRECSTASSEQR